MASDINPPALFTTAARTLTGSKSVAIDGDDPSTNTFAQPRCLTAFVLSSVLKHGQETKYLIHHIFTFSHVEYIA